MNYKTKSSRTFKPVFYREKDEITYSSKIPRTPQKFLSNAINNRRLIATVGKRLGIEYHKIALDWFNDAITVNAADTAGSTKFTVACLELTAIEESREEYGQFLSVFDDSIRGFEIAKTMNGSSKNAHLNKIRTVHETIDHRKMLLPLQEESGGTLKIIVLYPSIRLSLMTGGVLFVDELSMQLHPLLVRYLIQTFANPEKNPKNAQLIMTLQDVSHLNDCVLRRDEIWFTKKDHSGASTLYSLYDFEEDFKKPGSGEGEMKNYLMGKYGAIPLIQKIASVGTDCHEEPRTVEI